VTTSARRYTVAAALVVVAVALGATFGVVMARAVAGYDIAPVADPARSVVTVGDRPLAVWVSPQTATTYCSASDVDRGGDTMNSGLNGSMTVTVGSRSWKRVGVIEGKPGSRHELTCSADTDLAIGTADNPRVARYIVLGLALGGTAVLLVLIAFTLALVTALRRTPGRQAS
jgi:hypothetical protein